MPVKISERLALVVPLYDEKEQVYAYVHSMPISREVFEVHWRLLAHTFTSIAQLGIAIGPRMSYVALKDTAKALAALSDGDADKLVLPLMNELQRLGNVVLATDKGWETIPLSQAIDGKLIDPDDAQEALSAVVFFTAAWHMQPRATRAAFATGGARVWGAEISSLSVTAFAASLPTSTVTAPSGEKSTETEAPPRPAMPLRTPGATVQVEGRVASSLPS